MPSIRRLSFRKLLSVVVLGGALVAGSGAALAETYPNRPVRFVVPFPPGGAIDTLARLVGQQLQTMWGQPVAVENRPGASGIIGTQQVANAAPDGYTIGWGAVSTHGINAGLYAKLPYDPVKDFAPITPVAVVPNLLVVNPSVQAKSVKELIDLALERPGQLSYASAGTGTTLHISCELFKSLAKVDMLHVPYKGSGPAVVDVISGQVPVMCDSVTSALPHIKGGKLRALGITSAKRSSALPEVPTIAEAGLQGYEMSPWFGMFAPAGTPSEVVAKVNADVRKVLSQPAMKARLTDIGADVVTAMPEEFAATVRADVEKWGKLVREAGISLD